MVCRGGDDGYGVWMGWKRREGLRGGFSFVFEDFVEGGGEEPGRGEDVGSALAFEEEGEPEGEGGSVGWSEGFCCALGAFVSMGIEKERRLSESCVVIAGLAGYSLRVNPSSRVSAVELLSPSPSHRERRPLLGSDLVARVMP